MSVVVQGYGPDDRRPATDRPIQADRAAFGAGAVRLYSNELDEDFDPVEGESLETIAAGGKADIESGDFVLIDGQADTDALYERIIGQVQAALAAEKA